MSINMGSYTRRQALSVLGTISVGLAGCFSQDNTSGTIGSINGEWTVEGRDSSRTRAVSDGPADPETVWTTDLAEVRGVGTPSIAGDQLYVPVDADTDRARRRFGLLALDASKGDERWRVPLRSNPNESPAIGNNRCIVSTRRALERGRLVAFTERLGDEKWLYDIDARVTAPPIIAGSTVYLSDWEGYVHALSVFDGAVRWARQIGPNGTNRTFPHPIAVTDGVLYVGSYSGRTGVVAVDVATGDELWTRSTSRVSAGPVVHDGLVVVRCGSLVRAFDTDGTDDWTFNLLDDYWEVELAVGDQHVFVPTGDRLYAITRSGEKAWKYEHHAENVSPPTVVGDTVVLHESGRLIALAQEDGATKWRVETDGSGAVIATPTAMFMSGPSGRVTALGAE